MSNLNLSLAIDTNDLIATGLSALACYMYKLPAGQGAAEQFGAILVGKNLANNTAMLDRANPSGSLIKECDVWTAITRGSYSAFQKRSTNRILVDAVKGAGLNVAARYISPYINVSMPNL